MNKKILLLAPLIFSLVSCQITKVKLTKNYTHESDVREEVFSHEIRSYEDFKNMHDEKESFIMYIYNDKNCMCYLNLKSISKDFVIENELLVYTMDVEVIKNKNSFGYKTSGHAYPSITIFEEGYLKYQVDYDQDQYFEVESKYIEYMTARIEL